MQLTQSKKGFTLIEMMVSVALFSLVMLTGMAALVTMISNNKQAQSLGQSMSSVNFALDSISRALRTGTNYRCDGGLNCPSGGSRLTFVNQDGNTITYQAIGSVIYRCEASNCNVNNRVALTDSNAVAIGTARFFVEGVTPSDSVQPRVRINISGTSLSAENPQDFSVQTLVTQRIIDL